VGFGGADAGARRRAGMRMLNRPAGGDKDHLERARPMDALHPFQLDVTGGGRAADPGERTAGGQPGQGLRDQADDLLGPHHAQVVVGDEGQRAPSLVR